jgi:hypothetical protein
MNKKGMKQKKKNTDFSIIKVLIIFSQRAGTFSHFISRVPQVKKLAASCPIWRIQDKSLL